MGGTARYHSRPVQIDRRASAASRFPSMTYEPAVDIGSSRRAPSLARSLPEACDAVTMTCRWHSSLQLKAAIDGRYTCSFVTCVDHRFCHGRSPHPAFVDGDRHQWLSCRSSREVQADERCFTAPKGGCRRLPGRHSTQEASASFHRRHTISSCSKIRATDPDLKNVVAMNAETRYSSGAELITTVSARANLHHRRFRRRTSTAAGVAEHSITAEIGA